MEKNGNQKQYNLTSLEYGAAGAFSGIITRFLGQPLDVLKIRFQLQIENADKAKYTSMSQALKLMVAEEGFGSLWKGHNSAQLLSITFGAVQFSTYERLYEIFNKDNAYESPMAIHLLNIGCGSAAGIAAAVVSFPFDVIRTHLIFQGEPKVYKGTVDAAIKLYQSQGITVFRRGLLAAAIQTAPMSGLTFSFKGVFREIWFWILQQTEVRQPSSLSTSATVVTSLLAGVFAKMLVYPFDLMKKRLQIQGFDTSQSCCKEMIKCDTITQCFLLTCKKEGFLGLFKGMKPSLLKAGTSTAIYFTVYDKMCALIAYSKR